MRTCAGTGARNASSSAPPTISATTSARAHAAARMSAPLRAGSQQKRAPRARRARAAASRARLRGRAARRNEDVDAVEHDRDRALGQTARVRLPADRLRDGDQAVAEGAPEQAVLDDVLETLPQVGGVRLGMDVPDGGGADPPRRERPGDVETREVRADQLRACALGDGVQRSGVRPGTASGRDEDGLVAARPQGLHPRPLAHLLREHQHVVQAESLTHGIADGQQRGDEVARVRPVVGAGLDDRGHQADRAGQAARRA